LMRAGLLGDGVGHKQHLPQGAPAGPARAPVRYGAKGAGRPARPGHTAALAPVGGAPGSGPRFGGGWGRGPEQPGPAGAAAARRNRAARDSVARRASSRLSQVDVDQAWRWPGLASAQHDVAAGGAGRRSGRVHRVGGKPLSAVLPVSTRKTFARAMGTVRAPSDSLRPESPPGRGEHPRMCWY